MPKRPRLSAEAPIQTPNKSRSDIMADYADRQRKRGHVQVKLWVPKPIVEWLHQMADEARMLHEVGLKPLERLPTSLIQREAE